MTQALNDLMQLLKTEPSAFCVSWIQRRLRLGFSNACALRDEALNLGLVQRVERFTANGEKEFAYVLPGRTPQADPTWTSMS